MVAQMLAEMGYQVTTIDPYDGSAGGPTDYEEFRKVYTGVNIVRNVFPAGLPHGDSSSFDCIYSISVLEHFSKAALSEIFDGIRVFLKPRGVSLHSVDYVTEGKDAEFHSRNMIEILNHQMKLNDVTRQDGSREFDEMDRLIREDLETFYLSASGHNLWRGRTPYEQFPFRKVVSILSCVRASRGGLRLI